MLGKGLQIERHSGPGCLTCIGLWAARGRHKHACVVHAEGDAAADDDDDDPRPRRWNHAFVVFTAMALVVTALGFGIAEGCVCGP